MIPAMHICHVTAEIAPIAKVGGLADVVAGLTANLAKNGHTVTIILPKYHDVPFENITCQKEFCSQFFGEKSYNRLWRGTFNGCNLLLIDPDHPHQFFHRGKIYGCHDDLFRFLYFSRAVYDLLKSDETLNPDLLHLHDWQTAPLTFFDLKFPICLTLHNLAYQGLCQPSDFASIGLETKTDNILKEAIARADALTTVSPTYSREALTPEKGMGLETTLEKYREKWSGILNGIDTDYWNPSTDPFFSEHYSLDFPQGKLALKQSLRRELGLSQENRPLVGCVTRLVPQKGVELIKYGIHQIIEKGGQVALLGSSPIPHIQDVFETLKRELNNNPNASLFLEYNEGLAHRIFGGSDMFIIPSLFEPCGLTQMISLRYGTLPIVRKTGGLADTIFEGENGFVFEAPTPCGFGDALQRAIDCYHNPTIWQKMMERGMSTDYSWTIPAKHYIALYNSLIPSPVK